MRASPKDHSKNTSFKSPIRLVIIDVFEAAFLSIKDELTLPRAMMLTNRVNCLDLSLIDPLRLLDSDLHSIWYIKDFIVIVCYTWTFNPDAS